MVGRGCARRACCRGLPPPWPASADHPCHRYAVPCHGVPTVRGGRALCSWGGLCLGAHACVLERLPQRSPSCAIRRRVLASPTVPTCTCMCVRAEVQARNEEKANGMMNRWVTMRTELTAEKKGWVRTTTTTNNPHAAAVPACAPSARFRRSHCVVCVHVCPQRVMGWEKGSSRGNVGWRWCTCMLTGSLQKAALPCHGVHQHHGLRTLAARNNSRSVQKGV
jgi:hypothetical protein